MTPMMNVSLRMSRRMPALSLGRRFLSADESTKQVVVKRSTGASIVQRLSSFVVGAGLMALVTQYYIFEELRQGNQIMLAKQKDLEERLTKVEKK